MPIEGLSTTRRMPRLGKFHLGIRHPEKGYPMKVDYFVLPQDNPACKDIVRLFGEKPKELRIMIPLEDEEKWASQYYRCYSKTRGLICKGDGVTATRMVTKGTSAMADAGSKEVEMKDIPCKGRECPDYKVKCKEVMNLQFLLPEVPGLGVWQVDTSSINSIININSTAELIKSIYKRIAMIPLLLTLEPREVNNPETGKKQTVYCLNIRVNMKLNDLALLARKQTELLELPIADDETPEFSPEFEPDPIEVAPSTTTVQQDIDELWGPEKGKKPESSKPQPVKSESDVAFDALKSAGTSKSATPTQPAVARDPDTLKTRGDFLTACIKDFPESVADTDDVLRLLGYGNILEIKDFAGDYRKLLARKANEAGKAPQGETV